MAGLPQSYKKSHWTDHAVGIMCGVAAGAAVFAVRTLSPPRSLRGKVVVITGGSRGLGLELARQLGRLGCRLVLVARHLEELERAAFELRRTHVPVHIVTADVSNAESVQRLRDEVLEVVGGIDILINNAGVMTVGPIDSLQESDFEQAMSVMYWGTVRPTLAFLPTLLKSGNADIVNITSIGGKIAVPHLLPYSAAKFAMTGFSKGLGAELRQRGVYVLTVTPGLMRTGSFVNAEFTGDAEAEYRWFAAGAALPGLSINVERAAAQIIRSLQHRERERTITILAQIGVRLAGVFPSLSQWIVEKANQWILPPPRTEYRHWQGKELDRVQTTQFHKLTRLGQTAALTHNEKYSS